MKCQWLNEKCQNHFPTNNPFFHNYLQLQLHASILTHLIPIMGSFPSIQQKKKRKNKSTRIGKRLYFFISFTARQIQYMEKLTRQFSLQVKNSSTFTTCTVLSPLSAQHGEGDLFHLTVMPNAGARLSNHVT